jgi:arsenite oxidase large subunit
MVYSTACDYCIVGCAYKAFVWPVGKEGGPKKNENAFGVDFPRKPVEGWWISPNMHTIVFIDGKPHHAIVTPNADAKTVNKGGNHSIRGGRIAQKCYTPTGPTSDRLKTPLIRTGGMLQPISWEDATTIVAEVGKYVLDKYGELAYGSQTYSYQFFENTYAITKFLLGSVETPVWAHHDKPSSMSDSTALEDMGIDSFGPSYEDYSLADVIFVFGHDPFVDQTVLYTTWFMGGKAKLITVVPRASTGATQGEKNGGLLLQPYPGSDAAFLNAMCRYILEQGWEDKEFIAKWVANDEEINWGSGRGTRNTPWQWRTTRWGRSFKKYKDWILKDEFSTLEFAEKTTGIPREKIIKACELLTNKGQSPRPKASFIHEKGAYWSNNYLNTLAFANLALLCGAGNRPGQVIGRGGGHQRGMIQGAPYPIAKTPERFGLIGRKQLDVQRWMLSGNIRFFWVIGCQWINNMMASQFLADYVRKHTVGSPHQLYSLDRDEAIRVLKARVDAGDMVLVEQDIYPRDIAQYADIIFAAATWGEVDFTRAQGERRLRIYEKFYDPPGEAKPDWWIVAQVAKKMGYEGYDWKTSEEVFIEAARFSRNGTLDYAPLVEYAKMKGVSPYDLLRKRAAEGYQLPLWLKDGEIVETKRLHDSTRTDIGTPVGISTTHKRLSQFTSPSGKAILHIADWRLYKDFYDRITPDPKKGEIWITNGRVNEIWQSLFDDMRKPYIMERYPMMFIEINPVDAKARGIETGDYVAVQNDDVLVQVSGFYFETHEEALFSGLMKAGHIKQTKGGFTAMAFVLDTVRPGVAYAYFLWPGSPSLSVSHCVPDPITNAPRYKMGKGRVWKIGETPMKGKVTSAPPHVV